ncbi:MAG TPA: serine hydrolase domain-containing protein [Bacteroidales bacterium]|jgi:CubicO group peptidase (beta-lactamase class C family)|nr:serine hydrolase domain-containing protein [Bacteroidales bacterium]
MISRKIIPGIIILFSVLSSISGQTCTSLSSRVGNIADRIGEFISPESILYPEKFDSAKSSSIAERMDYYKVPGVSIVIFNENEAVTLTFGTTKAGLNQPVNKQTLFQAASTSKLITSVIVMKYVQDGILDLDTDVNSYLKSWKIPGNEFTRSKKITLRLLLVHDSGLPSTNFSFSENDGTLSLQNVLNGYPEAGNEAAIPVKEPGSGWQYSNIGFVLIQMILEDVTGKKFADIAQEIIFKPLKMKSSTFVYPLVKSFSGNEAIPHTGDGKTGQPMMHPVALAHGGLMTTPSDLAIFSKEIIKAYKGENSELIHSEYARQLLSKQLELDPKMFGFPVSEGLGVMLIEKGDNLLFTHPGSNLPGTNCWLIASLKSGEGAIVMTNGEQGELLGIEIITAVSKEFGW